eukprot:937774-Pyramimonas_sp.AAC.1
MRKWEEDKEEWRRNNNFGPQKKHPETDHGEETERQRELENEEMIRQAEEQEMAEEQQKNEDAAEEHEKTDGRDAQSCHADARARIRRRRCM